MQEDVRVPMRYRTRWLKDALNLSDVEMALVLNVSVSTIRRWLNEYDDKCASGSDRFQRLLGLVELADGVIRPDRLGSWLHTENKALGELVPLHLMANPAGYRLVASVLEDLRTGAMA
jgi:hypothetical protein